MAKVKLYCLMGKDGTLHYETISNTKLGVWENGSYFIVADVEGYDWRNKYWKRLEASIASAKRLGWAIVPVKVTAQYVGNKR